jgi:hypothetical protein
MNEKKILNETMIEMMMDQLINQYKNNKKEFIEGVIKTTEYIQVVPAGHPLMSEEIIKMSLKFTLDKYDIINFF